MGTIFDQPSSDYKYWAFISYSHADEKWAGWLHKALETYGVPKVLVGKNSKQGKIPKKAYPVFRDRDELPTSADLGEKLTSALRSSRFLIVICSPKAVASKWVNEEIRIYKAMGREDRVLCLIVDGEPYASENPQWGLAECFPEPVRYKVDPDGNVTDEKTEPIAADVRRGKDGRQNARLKILAGMFGVNFSDLKQRDHERERRRMHYILAGVSILFMVFCVLFVFLYLAKENAVEARRMAEGERLVADQAAKRAKEALSEAFASRAAEQKALLDARLAERDAKNAEAKAVAAANDLKVALTKTLEAQKREQEALKQAETNYAEALNAKGVAERALATAETNRVLAEMRKSQFQRALALADSKEAARLTSAGEDAKALAYLARSLNSDPANSSVEAKVISMLVEKDWTLPQVPPLNHKGPVTAVHFSPDGQSVLTASGNDVFLWQSNQFQKAAVKLSHAGVVRHAEFSPDGSLVLTASDDRSARLWNARTGQPVGKPMLHEDWVYEAAFGAGGKMVVTSSHDRSARVWDGATGDPLTGPMRHDGVVRTSRFSPDGRLLAVAAENDVRLWDVATGSPQGGVLRHGGGVYSLAFSPDGSLLVTGSGDRQVRLWNTSSGSQLPTSMAHDDWVNQVAFSPDGMHVASASRDGITRVWNVPDGQAVGEPIRQGLSVNHLAFSPNGLLLASASLDRTVGIWDAWSGVAALQPIRLESPPSSLDFSPDGRWLIVGTESGDARVVSAVSGKPLIEPFVHGQAVLGVAFSPDEKFLASASSDRTVVVWNLGTGAAQFPPMNHRGEVQMVEFSPDGSLLASAMELQVQVWDARTGQPIHDRIQHTLRITAMVFSGDGKALLTAGRDRQAMLWNARTGEKLWAQPALHQRTINSAVFSSDGRFVLTSSDDGMCKIWEASTGELVREGFNHSGEITQAVFSQDGKWLATSSRDKTARIWNATTGEALSAPLPHDAQVNAVAFDPTGRFVATGTQDRLIRIWEAESGRPATEPIRQGGEVVAVEFSRDGRLLSCLLRGSDAVVLDTLSWSPISTRFRHERIVRDMVISPSAGFLATASDDRTAKVWQISLPGDTPEWLPELAEIVGGYTMSEAGGTTILSNPWEQYAAVQKEVLSSENQHAKDWGQWFLADRRTRTVSAFSKIPTDAYLEQASHSESDVRVLRDMLRVSPDHGFVISRLAQNVQRLQLPLADFYSRKAVEFSPVNPEVLWVRAAVLLAQGKTEPAWEILQRALAVEPRSPAQLLAEGYELDRYNQSETRSKGWLPKGWTDLNAKEVVQVDYARVMDLPPDSKAGFRIQAQSPRGRRASVGGPRYIAQPRERYTLEGWVRSPGRSDLGVSFVKFLEPQTTILSDTIRTTEDWKRFRVSVSHAEMLAGEVVLQVPSNATVDVAGLVLKLE